MPSWQHYVSRTPKEFYDWYNGVSEEVAEFEVAELKTIIDAVASSKFIAEGKSNELIKKLTSLAGSHKARELKRNVIVDGRGKIENKQILYIIDAINDAINQRKKISFQKIEYNIKKERILHHGGERVLACMGWRQLLCCRLF